MLTKKNSNSKAILADMHQDGIRFDPEIVEAIRALRAIQGNQIQPVDKNE